MVDDRFEGVPEQPAEYTENGVLGQPAESPQSILLFFLLDFGLPSIAHSGIPPANWGDLKTKGTPAWIACM